MNTNHKMAEHIVTVEWRYAVPAMDRRVFITQRQDGPFQGDAIGGSCGHYYSSLEEFRDGCWSHVPGSTTGGHSSFDAAFRAAESAWNAAVTKAAGSVL